MTQLNLLSDRYLKCLGILKCVIVGGFQFPQEITQKETSAHHQVPNRFVNQHPNGIDELEMQMQLD